MFAAELRGANKPNLNEALGWIGSRVDDIYGTGVGRLEDVWIDPGSGAPRWLLIKEGRFGGRTTLIPFEDATAGAGHVWVPYERDVVRNAPEVEPGAPLTQQIESALRSHFAANAPAAAPHSTQQRVTATSGVGGQASQYERHAAPPAPVHSYAHASAGRPAPTPPPPLRPPAPPARPAASLASPRSQTRSLRQQNGPPAAVPAVPAPPQRPPHYAAPPAAPVPAATPPPAAPPVWQPPASSAGPGHQAPRLAELGPAPVPPAPVHAVPDLPPVPLAESPSELPTERTPPVENDGPTAEAGPLKLESLEDGYMVEIQLKGGVMITGKLESLRLLPANGEGEGDDS